MIFENYTNKTHRNSI